MMVGAMGIAPRREIEKDTARGGKNGADCFVFSAVCITFVAKIYNMYKKTILAMALLAMSVISTQAQKQPVDYVDPFIGTTNFSVCNPGAIRPHGLMSVVPFNVMGSDLNVYDKDSRRWSTPYVH